MCFLYLPVWIVGKKPLRLLKEVREKSQYCAVSFTKLPETSALFC